MKTRRYMVLLSLGLTFCAPPIAHAQQFFPCDTPKVIATPEQAIERARAFILEYSIETSTDQDSYSTLAMKQLAHDLLNLHVITSSRNEDTLENWIIQPGKDKFTRYVVNRANGDVIVEIKDPSFVPTQAQPPPYLFLPQPISKEEIQEERELNGAGVHQYRIQENGDSYSLTVTFNPVLHDSKHDYMFSVELNNIPSHPDDKQNNIVIGRVYHVQNLESATFILNKSDLKACPDISVITVGNNGGSSPASFTVDKLPSDNPNYWKEPSDPD